LAIKLIIVATNVGKRLPREQILQDIITHTGPNTYAPVERDILEKIYSLAMDGYVNTV
jgi:hypothetical protein